MRIVHRASPIVDDGLTGSYEATLWVSWQLAGGAEDG
jgi:hypothetical protein